MSRDVAHAYHTFRIKGFICVFMWVAEQPHVASRTRAPRPKPVFDACEAERVHASSLYRVWWLGYADRAVRRIASDKPECCESKFFKLFRVQGWCSLRHWKTRGLSILVMSLRYHHRS